MEPKVGKKRKPFITILKLSISSVLIVFILNRIGLDSIIAQFKHANWFFIVLSILCFTLSNIFGSFQWFLLLKYQKIRVKFGQILSFYHVGLFFNNFLIGYVGGDAFRIYDITKSSGDSTAALSTVLFDRFMGFLSLTTLAMLVAVFFFPMLSLLNTLFFIAVILAAWLFGLYLLFNEKAARFFIKYFKRFIPSIVFNKTRDVYKAINYFRHNKRLMFKVFIIALAVQSLRVLVHYLAAKAVGVQTKLFYFYVFVPIIAMAASLPISMGGIGVREQSGVSMFASVGIPASQVVSFEFLAYLVAVMATIPGGLVFALRKEKFKYSPKS